MKPTRRLVMSAAGAVVGVGLVGLLVAKHFEPPSRPFIPTAVAKVGDVESDVLATGSVEPANVVDVGSEVSGRVMSLKVAVGDIVKKGDLIAIVDPSRLVSQVQQQQTSIAQAQANLRDRLAQLDIARKEVDRQKTLLDRGVSSQATYDIAVANLNSGIAQTENQRQQIANEQLILEQRQQDLDKSNIRAPIDGIVAEVVTREGATINTNFNTPVIVKLAQTNVMTVQTEVSEADIMKVRPGQKAYFTILGEPEDRHYATVADREVTPVGSTLNPEVASGTTQGAVYYNVTFETPNADNKLLPSMTAEVHVVLEEAKNVVTIPKTALEPPGRDGKPVVEIEEPNGKLVQREVTVGVENDFTAEIRQGLKAGDKVVLSPAPVVIAQR